MITSFAKYNVKTAYISYGGGIVKRVRGYYTGAADAFLRIYDSMTILTAAGSSANDAALVRCLPVYAQSPFDFDLENDHVICKEAIQMNFSTADQQSGLTLASEGSLQGVFVDTDGMADASVETSADGLVIGPLTGRILRIDAINNADPAVTLLDGYIQLHSASPEEDMDAEDEWHISLADTESTRLDFGRNGYKGKVLTGFYLGYSGTRETYVAAGDAINIFRVFYKAS